MKNKILIILFSFLVVQSIFLPNYSQVKDSLVNIVYLKDGSVVKGTIIETEPGKTITIRTSEGMIYKYDFKKDIKDMDVEVYWTKSPAQMNDSLEYEVQKELEKNMPWRSSFYFAAGGGFPQIFRIDIGYNFGSYFSLGISYGNVDFWPDKLSSLALIAKLHLPTSTSVVPYFLLGLGGAETNKLEPALLEYTEATNSFKLFYFGLMISLTSLVQLRPELGLVVASKYIRSEPGSELFHYKRIYEDNTRLGFNISLEVDL
ncbi:MAG TPA: hypothetical protein VMT35_07435 [Ignavibacteriaceae bacterium]|nr:hypothetical protein [Ignavibacteriaceae bacterium]